MNVNLYLHESDFKYNGRDTVEDLKKRFKLLINDLSVIQRTDTTLYYSESLSEITIYPKQNIFEFAEQTLDEEEKGFFYALWDENAVYFSMGEDELEKKTHYLPDEQECNARVVLNAVNTEESDNRRYITFDLYKVIYDSQSWNTLQRQILGNHPEDVNSFVLRCRTCFDKLVFGNKCHESMQETIDICSRKIVYYLSCINDCFLDFLKVHPNKNSTNVVLADFAGMYGMDRAGSLQRNAKDKANYTFEFDVDKRKRTCVCDAHFKIQHGDKGGKEREIARIYIYYGKADCPEEKVWVGAMGAYHA